MKIFITGISRGLGNALAKECISRGHEVWGVARTNPSDIEELIHYTKCDIANYNEVDNVYKEMISANYIPDVLILNAAVVKDDFYKGIDLKAVRETLEVNFFGNLYWLQLFFHHFSGRPESCIFVNISSVSTFRAIVGNKISIGYPASKSAMDMIFEGMRIQCKSKKVRFITINLGPLGDRRKMPFVSSTYRQAAKKIVGYIEGKMIRNTFSYPAITGFIYKVFRIVPDSILRRITLRMKKD